MVAQEQIGKILVVDDSKTVRNFLASLLRDAGYDISLAEDGRQGWQIIQHEQIDLIISDLEMPELDGFGLSLVYDTITNKHHGTIRVQSEPGQETIFTLHIPCQA